MGFWSLGIEGLGLRTLNPALPSVKVWESQVSPGLGLAQDLGFASCILGPNAPKGGQNCGPFLGTINIGCHIIIGIQKGTIIWTTTPMDVNADVFK